MGVLDRREGGTAASPRQRGWALHDDDDAAGQCARGGHPQPQPQPRAGGQVCMRGSRHPSGGCAHLCVATALHAPRPPGIPHDRPPPMRHPPPPPLPPTHPHGAVQDATVAVRQVGPVGREGHAGHVAKVSLGDLKQVQVREGAGEGGVSLSCTGRGRTWACVPSGGGAWTISSVGGHWPGRRALQGAAACTTACGRSATGLALP